MFPTTLSLFILFLEHLNFLIPPIFAHQTHISLWSSFQVPLIPQCCPLAPYSYRDFNPCLLFNTFCVVLLKAPFLPVSEVVVCVLVSVQILQGKSCVVLPLLQAPTRASCMEQSLSQ